jgi:hypothetical protein
MELTTRKTTVRSLLNKILRMTQRVEITKLSTKTLTVRNVYKNKQIIQVESSIFDRCYLPL